MKKKFIPLTLDKVKTYPIEERKNLVRHADFATLTPSGSTVSDLLRSLPAIYKGQELRDLLAAMVRAVQGERPIAAGIGGHVVKCGLAPLLIDLMERGILWGLAMPGSTAIHDYEIAMIGETSEDVGNVLSDGRFGLARETGDGFREAAREGAQGKGLGRALGEIILARSFPYRHLSVLATAARLDLPLCVLVATGNDIIHMHPQMNGGELGEASYLDFRLLTALVAEMNGGVWLNIGSAVILPEAFVKAISIVCNLGHPLDEMTTANFDMIDHYRPRVNVVRRPPGRGFHFTGHHEIMLPLLFAALREALS